MIANPFLTDNYLNNNRATAAAQYLKHHHPKPIIEDSTNLDTAIDKCQVVFATELAQDIMSINEKCRVKDKKLLHALYAGL